MRGERGGGMRRAMAQNLLSSPVRGVLTVLREAAAEILPSRSKGVHCGGREMCAHGGSFGNPPSAPPTADVPPLV